MKEVILLALLGACWGLKENLEYQYRYSGRVASGIPSLKNQFSGAGIQADVTFQITRELKILFQLSNIEVGVYHGKVECDTRAPLPIIYQPLVDGKELLELPFETHPGKRPGEHYLELPEEPAWITNIKKAIVRVFGIPPLLRDVGRDSFTRTTFSVNETILQGDCLSWYSMIRLSAEQAAREDRLRKSVMGEDVQREDKEFASYTSSKDPSETIKNTTSKTTKTTSKTTSTKITGSKGAPAKLTTPDRIDNTLWSMSRTVDFDSCENLVKFEIHGNKKTKKKIRRTCVGTYLLRGNERGTRIEYAVIEGSITVFTSKLSKQHISTFTNQTLELKAVRRIKNLFTIDYPTQTHQNYHYEVDHLLDTQQDPGHDKYPSLEQLVTGIPVTTHGATDIMNLIIRRLEEIATRITTRPYSKDPLVRDLSILVEAVSILSRLQIDEVCSKIQQGDLYAKKVQIFYEVLATAGTEPAIDYLLDKISNSEFRVANYVAVQNILDTIHISVKNPLVIPKLIDLVKILSWNEADQVFKSTGLLNLASLAKQLCLSSDKWETFGYNTCDPQFTCTPDIIIEKFLPVLIQGVQDEESPVWRRVVYLQALANLGTPQTINVLKHFVLGDREKNLVLRTNAIFGLSGLYLPKTAQSTVFDILMPVFENTGEHYEVRTLAFLAMTTYEPSQAWWQRMAISTWRDPSSQVANYISATITSLAHGTDPLSKSAARVVHLVKPPAHLSLTHSSMIYLNDYVYSCKSRTHLNIGWLASTKGVFPSKVLFRLQMNTLLGFKREFKAILHQQDLNRMLKTIHAYINLERHHETKTSDSETVGEMFDEIMEQLSLIHTSQTPDMTFYLKMNDALFFVPPSMTSAEDLIAFFADEKFKILSNTPHIERFVDYTEVLPTDLGLPFMIQYTEQHAFWLDWKLLDVQSRPSKTEGAADFILDFSQDNTLETKTLLPWSQSFGVGAGLHNLFALVVPLTVHTNIDFDHSELKLTIELQDNNKIQLVNSHNFPYTVVTGPFPTTVLTEETKYKKIRTTDLEAVRRSHLLPSLVGISVETYWSADFPFPENLATIYSGNLAPFTPTYKSWDYRLELDPAASTTKSVTFTLAYVTMESSRDIVKEETFEQMGQETQGVADHVDFSQISSGGSLAIQKFGQGEAEPFGLLQNEQQENQSRQRIVKLLEDVMPITGGRVNGVSLGVELEGSPSRSYEAVVTWAFSKSSSQISTKVQLTLFKNPTTGVLEEPHVTCVSVQMLKPKFAPLATVEEVLSTNFHTTIEAEVYDGVSCLTPPVLEVQGVMDVRDEVISRLREDLAKDCDAEAAHLLPIDIITSPLYDHIQFTARWNENYPVILKNMSYHVDDFLKGVLFPLTSFDHTAVNPENRIDIDATKCLESNTWTIRDVRPQSVAITNGLKLPVLLEALGGPAKIRKIFDYNAMKGRSLVKCVVEKTKVRTHDGVVFPYHPDSCWTTLSIGHPLEEGKEGIFDGVLMARFTDQWEVRIVWKWAGFMYEFTKSQLLVNGELYKGGDNLIKFIEVNNTSLFVFKRMGSYIKISDKIEVVQPYIVRGGIDGLCGRMDGEKSHDLIGPKGCIYTDPALFALSWTTPGDGCSLFSLRSKTRAVEQYQEACPRETSVPTGVSHPQVVYDCTEWEYIERTYRDYRCKAMVATPVCKQECRETGSFTKPIEYDCQLTGSRRNNTEQECQPYSLVTTYPASCVP